MAEQTESPNIAEPAATDVSVPAATDVSVPAATDVSADAETVAIAVPEQEPVRPRAMPRRIEPAAPTPAPAPAVSARNNTRRWLIAAAAAVAVIGLAAAGLAVKNQHDVENSAQTQINRSITGFMHALTTGNITTLREATAGPLADFYRTTPDQQFADAYRTSVQQKTIPVVRSIDGVHITDPANAIAQLSVTIPNQPGVTVVRSINLRKTDSGWKITDQP